MKKVISLSVVLMLVAMAGCVKQPAVIVKDQENKDYYQYNLPISIGVTELDSNIKLAEKKFKKNKDFMIMSELADLYYKRGKRDGNIKDLQLALNMAQKSIKDQESFNQSAKITLAKLYENQHQFKKAIEVCEAILKNPGSAKSNALYILATSNLALGNYDKSLKYISELSDAYPRVGTLALKGLILISSGKREEGISLIKRGLKNEDIGEQTDSAWARIILARYLIEDDQDVDAEILIKESLRINKTELGQFQLAQLLIKKGSNKEAELILTELTSKSKDYVYQRNLADLLTLMGQTEKASLIYAKLEKEILNDIKQGYTDHRLELVKVYISQGKNESAKKQIKEEFLVRDTYEMRKLSSLINLNTNDKEGSVQDLKKVIANGYYDRFIYNVALKINEQDLIKGNYKKVDNLVKFL